MSRPPQDRVLTALLACLVLPLLTGFALENSTVPRDEIQSGGPPKDGIPALLEPRLVPAGDAGFLGPDDRVVGFGSGDEARAYPLRVLNWHEVVNDSVGEQEIVVTWCPLTASAVVFDRRVGDDVLTFGVSGLLYQSNVLVYDHQSESLWSQLGRDAVAGKRVGGMLQALPSEVTSWKAWLGAHPTTLVLSDETGHRRDYGRDPYTDYHAATGLMFAPKHHDTRLADKTLVFGITVGTESVAYPLSALERLGTLSDRTGGRRVRITRDADSGAVRAVDGESGERLPGTSVYWFAWSAFHPETRIWKEPEAKSAAPSVM